MLSKAITVARLNAQTIQSRLSQWNSGRFLHAQVTKATTNTGFTKNLSVNFIVAF